VREHHPRKRTGASSVPPIDADAPKVVWALDFQFDSTVDGRAVKIASMVDEHTHESLLHLVQRSITAERLVAELEKVFAVRGTPRVLDGQRPVDDFPSVATVLCRPGGNRLHSYPARRGTTATSSRSTGGCGPQCLNRNHWTTLLDSRPAW
jgi:putative transposase